MKRLIARWNISRRLDREYSIYIDSEEYSVIYPGKEFDLSFNECMENLAAILNSPCSKDDVEYSLHFTEELDCWECEYRVYASCGMTASVYGYGQTTIKALEDCIFNYKKYQEIYNPDNIKV